MKYPTLFSMYNNMDTEYNMNKKISTNKTIRTIELFAGVGGFRIGLEKANFKDKNFEIVCFQIVLYI